MCKEKRKEVEHSEYLAKTEKENIRLTKKHYNKEIGSYVECFVLLYETIVHIIEEILRKDRGLNKVEAAIFFHCARIVISSRVSLDLVMKGYYYDAYIINRSVFESVFLVQCFVKDSKNVEKWERGEKIRFKKELDLFSSKGYEEAWQNACNYVHANIPAIRTLVEFHNEGRSVDIHFEPLFRLHSDTADLLFPSVGILMLHTLLIAFGNIIKPKIKAKIERKLKKWTSDAQKTEV